MKKSVWKVEFESLAKKELKKIGKKNPKLSKLIINEIDKLKENPLIGEELSGDLAGYRKLKLKFQSINYRIVYQIIDNEIIIVIVKINKRENFYRDLKRYLH